MNFLADECCDAASVASLRSDGHDVLYALESLRGFRDDQILRRAFQEQRILLTEDKDFGDLAIRLRQPVVGIILLRFDSHQRNQKVPRLKALIEQEAQNITGKFIVLEADKTRTRPLE